MVVPVRLFQHGRSLIDSGLGFARGMVTHRYLKDVFTDQTQVTQKDFPGPCPQVIRAIQETSEENTQWLLFVQVWNPLYIGVGDFDRKV